MEVVEHELAAVAKDRDLVADVLTLVAQAMCFGEAQKESLEDEPRKKVDMMLGSADFAPYRQAALEAPAVKRRVEDVQRMRAAAANKKAEQLKRERDQKRKARPNKKKTPLQEAADRLEVGGGLWPMLRGRRRLPTMGIEDASVEEEALNRRAEEDAVADEAGAGGSRSSSSMNPREPKTDIVCSCRNRCLDFVNWYLGRR